MNWTSQKPTVPGYYWWRSTYKVGERTEHVERIFRVVEGQEGLWTDIGWICELTGEWAGPLEPPNDEEPLDSIGE